MWGSNHRNFFPRSLSQDLKAQASTNCGKIAKNDRKNRFETKFANTSKRQKYWTKRFNELLPVKTFFDEIGDGGGAIGTSLTSLTFTGFFQLHDFFSHTGHRGPFVYPIGQVPLFCHLVIIGNQYH